MNVNSLVDDHTIVEGINDPNITNASTMVCIILIVNIVLVLIVIMIICTSVVGDELLIVIGMDSVVSNSNHVNSRLMKIIEFDEESSPRAPESYGTRIP